MQRLKRALAIDILVIPRHIEIPSLNMKEILQLVQDDL